MKRSIGVIRSFDPLGRIVVPKEILDRFDIGYKAPMEIFITTEEEIILKKYQPGCYICGKIEEKFEKHYMNRRICSDCATDLKNT